MDMSTFLPSGCCLELQGHQQDDRRPHPCPTLHLPLRGSVPSARDAELMVSNEWRGGLWWDCFACYLEDKNTFNKNMNATLFIFSILHNLMVPGDLVRLYYVASRGCYRPNMNFSYPWRLDVNFRYFTKNWFRDRYSMKLSGL